MVRYLDLRTDAEKLESKVEELVEEVQRLRESVERLEQHVQFARAKQARRIKPALFRMVKARRK